MSISLSRTSFSDREAPESDHAPSLPYEYEGAILCKKCSVLRIDDGKLGGFKADYWGRSRAPGSVLKLDADDRPRKITLDYIHEDHWPELPLLYLSAEGGCVFCVALIKAIRGVPPHPFMMKGIEIRLEYTWKSQANENSDPRNPCHGLNALTASIFPRGRGSSENDDEAFTTLVFAVEEGTLAVGDWLQLELGVADKPFSPNNFAMLRRQINRCERVCTHSKNTQDPNFIPTRLLDLDAPNAVDGICLIEAANAGFNQCPRYCALSYCWGLKEDSQDQLKTTTDSLRNHLTNITWWSLTRVIQDAVAVARALSVRYLWVDALCIIQGDHLDWERESGLMRRLFGNAYFTIAALSSNSCHETFLGRQGAVSIGFRSSIDPSIEGHYNIRHHPMFGRFKRYRDKNWYKFPKALDELGSRYTTRAWTLQEEELSARIVHFGGSRMYFKCLSFCAVEPFNQKLCDLLQTELRFSLTLRDAVDDGQPLGFIYTEWLYLIAHAYSPRQCGLREDRLPAISGLANCIAEATQDDYVAGLLRGDLTRGLLWNSNFSTHRSLTALAAALASPTPYVAPSWSWASQNRGVRFPDIRVQTEVPRLNYTYDSRRPWEPDPRRAWEYEPREECFDVEAIATLEDLSTDKFGRLKDGYLNLTGKVAKVASGLEEVKRTNGLLPSWRVKTEEGYTAFCKVDWLIYENEEEESDALDVKNVVLLMVLSTTSLTDFDDYLSSHGVRDGNGEAWEDDSEDELFDDDQQLDTVQSLRDEATNLEGPPVTQDGEAKDVDGTTSLAPTTTVPPSAEQQSEDIDTLQPPLPPTMTESPTAPQQPEAPDAQVQAPTSPTTPPPTLYPRSDVPPFYPTAETLVGLSNLPLPYNPQPDTQDNRKRQAWGLLLYPTGKEEEYVRVGVFTIRRRFGGVGAFEGVGIRRVRVV